jgi:Ice-binding-like/Putative Ig domain
MKNPGPIFVYVVFGLQLSAAQLPVVLGSTVTFGVLGGSTVTNTGPTVVNGDLGLNPGSSVTGFPPGSVTLPYGIHINDNPAIMAQADLTTAYNDAATPSRDGDVPVTVAGDLGGRMLTPGLYNSTSSLMIGVGEVLTLSGPGVFVFQMGSSLTTGVGSSIVLTNGASAANIFWQVFSSATLGTNSIFYGTILAGQSITLNTGAALTGRALAKAAVSLASNTVIQPGPAGPGGVLNVFCPLSFGDLSVTYNSVVSATGGTPPYTYSITGSLPPGLNFNPSTGAVTGVPTATGSSPFLVHVTDSSLATASQSCNISTGLTPSLTPLPSSLNLVLIGFVCTAVYLSGERLMRLLRRS